MTVEAVEFDTPRQGEFEAVAPRVPLTCAGVVFFLEGATPAPAEVAHGTGP